MFRARLQSQYEEAVKSKMIEIRAAGILILFFYKKKNNRSI